MLVGGLSRGVRGGQTRRPVGSGVSHLLTCYTTHKQHDVYVCVGLCVCRSVTPNSGVKSEKHFHLELIHSAAKERSPALAPGHLMQGLHDATLSHRVAFWETVQREAWL